MKRALALVDGEHYPDVVRAALAELPFEFVAAILVGGTEKLRGGEEYGVRIVDSLASRNLRRGPSTGSSERSITTLTPKSSIA